MGYDTNPRHHKPRFPHSSFFAPSYKLLFPELKCHWSRSDQYLPYSGNVGSAADELIASKYTCENIDTHQNMTKSKRMFAEMLVQARGHGDADEMAKTMSLVDIIYEIKKEELKKMDPSSTEESPPPVVDEKKEPEPVEEKKEEEPVVIVKIKDFWSRLTHDSDTD